MDRRKFLALTGTTAVLTGCTQQNGLQPAANGEDRPAKKKPVKMHVGTQRGPTSPRMLQYIKRHGVDHICGYPPKPGARGHWTVEELEQTKELCEKQGISLDVVALPFLSSSHVDRETGCCQFTDCSGSEYSSLRGCSRQADEPGR